ncbi:DEAD/DEAH box helicase [Deinococcus sonorensis]|uniref:DEAD/DEAH box helicase n=2 Tax=Deinococcus sonorensis TaxID=309891 RepID=A0AAU7UE13_9DEIO
MTWFASPAQEEIAASALLTSGYSCVLQLPTGAGKTHLAWQAMQEEVTSGGRAVFVVPLRALADQVHVRWSAERPDLKLGVYTGDHSGGVPLAEAQVLIMTPERLDACTRSWSSHWTWIPHVSLLVVDEFHLLGEGRRGARLEGTLLRFERLNPLCRWVTLSATLGNRAELADWLGALEYGSPWRPVPLTWREVTYPNPEAKRGVLLQLLREAQGGNTLVFVQSRRRAEGLAVALREAGFAADHHHAGLAPEARRAAEAAFTSGSTPVLVCTSTLELGLNLPCRRVVLYDLNSWDGKTFAPLPVRNAWQRAGRAGRYNLDDAGEVITVRAAWDRHTPAYAAGMFEPVRSALSRESFLLEQLVADISSGLLRSREGLGRYYARTLAAKQRILPPLKPLLDRALQAGLLTEQSDERRRLNVTPAGRVAARHLLAPETVLRWAHLAGFITPFDLLLFTLTLPDMEVRLPVDFEDLPALRADLARVPSILLRSSPAEVTRKLGVTGRGLLHALHTACAVWAVLHGEEEDIVAARASAYPFELRRLREEGVRILAAAGQWLASTAPDPADPTRDGRAHTTLVRRVTLLRTMLSGPMGLDAATLTRVPGIGVGWAKALCAHGILDLEALAASLPGDLRDVPRLGTSRAAQWIAAAEELVKDWAELDIWADAAPPALPVTSTALNTPVDPYRLKRASDLTVQVLDHGFRVTGGQEPHLITRRSDTLRCDCADHATGHTCKHLLAVRLRREPDLRAALTALQHDQAPDWSFEHLWMNA